MKKTFSVIVIYLIGLLSVGCLFVSCTNNVEQETGKKKMKIDHYPSVLDLGRGSVTEFPDYEPYPMEAAVVDLRGYDLRRLDLSNEFTGLHHADFSTATLWPFHLPDDYNPKRILELGKVPGIGLQELHEKGYTGKGIGVAIISEPLLVDHKEYFRNVVLYEEIPVPVFKYDEYFKDRQNVYSADRKERMIRTKKIIEAVPDELLKGSAGYRGTAIASLIAGNSLGVAPDADLYYFAPRYGSLTSGGALDYYKWILNTLDRIGEINHSLSEDHKIRAIFISKNLYYIDEAAEPLEKKLNELREQNILVLWDLYTSNQYAYSIHGLQYEYLIRGLGRVPHKDPNLMQSYGPGAAWEAHFLSYSDLLAVLDKGYILVPGDSRTTASPVGKKSYVFNRYSRSFTAPAFVTGLYLMSLSKKKMLSPQQFINKLIETGTTIEYENYNLKRRLYHIVNPERFLESF